MATKPNIIDQAAALQAAVESDPLRPRCHFAPLAQWMNDPTGPIFHEGWYHLFYQYNPFADTWGNIHWGHARSRDLVHWEHLPMALSPSGELNEEHCFSGCTTIDAQGKPVILYTSMAPAGLREPEQWAAFGDPQLVTWEKSCANPIMTQGIHGQAHIREWRDPYVFHAEGHTFMVMGGREETGSSSRPVVLLYESPSHDLTQWIYRGILFHHSDDHCKSVECPNFIKIGNKWVLFYSPFGAMRYVVGDFDAAAGRFQPITEGIVDHSADTYAHFYAPSTFYDAQGRCVLLGWVRGFPAHRGWAGCCNLPRVLTLDEQNRLVQKPWEPWRELRCSELTMSPPTDHAPGWQATLSKGGGALETLVELSIHHTTASVSLTWFANEGRTLSIDYDGHEIHLRGDKSVRVALPHVKNLRLHVFIDRSVIECFINDQICSTLVTDRPFVATSVDLQTDSFISVKQLKLFTLKG